MKKTEFKILMTALMALSMIVMLIPLVTMPVNAFPEVTSESELKSALDSGEKDIAVNGIVTNSKSLTINSGVKLWVGGSFTIDSGVTLTVKDTAIIETFGNSGKITNNGKITNSGTINGHIRNYGTIDNNKGGTISGIYNFGTVNNKGGTIDVLSNEGIVNDNGGGSSNKDAPSPSDTSNSLTDSDPSNDGDQSGDYGSVLLIVAVVAVLAVVGGCVLLLRKRK
jgi:hypothetical protein